MTSDHIFDRIGRRSLVLGLFGLMWILQGVGRVLADHNPARAGALHEGLDPRILGLAWIVTGVVALVVAGSNQFSTDALGFCAVGAMPLFYTASYLVTWLFWLAPGDLGAGQSLAFLSSSVWATIVGLIVIISGWSEPTHMPMPPDHKGSRNE